MWSQDSLCQGYVLICGEEGLLLTVALRSAQYASYPAWHYVIWSLSLLHNLRHALHGLCGSMQNNVFWECRLSDVCTGCTVGSFHFELLHTALLCLRGWTLS